MASSFKSLASGDATSTRTLLHESIPVTGSIVSGTYGGGTVALGSEPHIKTYSHGMFQSVFDYPHLSSSANHIFDITAGIADSSILSSSTTSQTAKKINIYNQMAQVLMGYDETGSVRLFDEDGNIVAGGTKLRECYFVNFSRILTKDEVKKGTFEMELTTTDGFAHPSSAAERIKITDSSGSDGYFVNSPAGEYGVLFATASNGANILRADQSFRVGLVFYQAGIAVISGSVFSDQADGGILNNSFGTVTYGPTAGLGVTGFNTITGSTIDVMANNLRNRLFNLQFNNTTELNSTIYFCRVNNSEFNYSANPTYLSTSSGGPSEIVIKDGSVSTDPHSYITTVGLYSADNELMAVAKLSEPIKKDPSNELTLRVRLDY
jgi:hypothetical protein